MRTTRLLGTVAMAAALLLTLPTTASAAVDPPPTRADGTTRVYGDDRYATAAKISRSSFPGGATDVFVVTGQDWPDALAAGAAAASVDAPVLLVQKSTVPAAIRTELDRLDPERAWVVGGTGAVGTAVTRTLRDRGIAVERLAGANRYETAARVQERFFPDPAGAYYASGETFADALGGSAAAAHRGWPLLLTARRDLPAATPVVGDERILLGGPGAVSGDVRSRLSARRIGGDDRYATAAAVARDAFSSSRVAYVATGATYPDALAGAVAAHRDGAPLLITPSCPPASVRQVARDLGVRARVVLGGPAVVGAHGAALTACPAPKPAPKPSPKPAPGPPADKDCKDFATQREAQAWFERYYPKYGDIARLDADNDRKACEALP